MIRIASFLPTANPDSGVENVAVLDSPKTEARPAQGGFVDSKSVMSKRISEMLKPVPLKEAGKK